MFSKLRTKVRISMSRTQTRIVQSAATIAILVTCVVASTVAADAQVSVFVPGNASGSFGNPLGGGGAAMVSALNVSGPGTITVTYVSGSVTDSSGVNAGPDGVTINMGGAQSPLQEQAGVSGGTIKNLDALIGVFVPKVTVSSTGFHAIDGTKDATPVGIKPGSLFFIGTGKTFKVPGAGTLFLGINDWIVSDNGGGFNVDVTGP